jgi:hypothetical protein
MNVIKKLAIKMLAVLSVVAIIASPVAAQGLSASDMAFAFGGKAAAPAAGQQTARAAVPKAAETVAIASARGMTQTEMQETEGAWIGPAIQIGRAVITGFTRHGLNQTINRGISPGAVVNTLRNPTSVQTFTSGANAGTTRYIGSQSTVVVNNQGRVVTTWGRGR